MMELCLVPIPELSGLAKAWTLKTDCCLSLSAYKAARPFAALHFAQEFVCCTLRFSLPPSLPLEWQVVLCPFINWGHALPLFAVKSAQRLPPSFWALFRFVQWSCLPISHPIRHVLQRSMSAGEMSEASLSKIRPTNTLVPKPRGWGDKWGFKRPCIWESLSWQHLQGCGPPWRQTCVLYVFIKNGAVTLNIRL